MLFFSLLLFYEPHTGGFSLHYFIFFCKGYLGLCSLDLIVFSLLLPRLSTSSPPSLPKNTSLWHESGVPYAQKRGTEAKTDDIRQKVKVKLRSRWSEWSVCSPNSRTSRTMTFRVSPSRCWVLPLQRKYARTEPAAARLAPARAIVLFTHRDNQLPGQRGPARQQSAELTNTFTSDSLLTATQDFLCASTDQSFLFFSFFCQPS